jgi:hypothetical protein
MVLENVQNTVGNLRESDLGRHVTPAIRKAAQGIGCTAAYFQQYDFQ